MRLTKALLVITLLIAQISGFSYGDIMIPPIPNQVDGVKQITYNLNGVWKFTNDPPERILNADQSSWVDIEVPGEPTMQGMPIDFDIEYPFARNIDIPADMAGKQIFIRFEGVYSYARVWVNGKLVTTHHGGFTTWEANITDLVTPGQTATLLVGVTDKRDDISFASNYAKHNIGGILRDVTLIARSPIYIARQYINTDLDATYTNATLTVNTAVTFATGSKAVLKYTLIDEDGLVLNPESKPLKLSSKKNSKVFELEVINPKKWDSEHPNLYTLSASLYEGDKIIEVVNTKIGFREIEHKGNKIFVNGENVKIRGINHHDVHALKGRVVSNELAEKDLQYFKDANINFIRTSHYPTSKYILDRCDELGFYVEEETGICWVGITGMGGANTMNDEKFTDLYINQLDEMVERDRNHPCIIMWSTGNESIFGSNFELSYKHLKEIEPTRPIIFSFPGSDTINVKRSYDVLGLHYPEYDSGLGHDESNMNIFSEDYGNDTIPEFNDEYQHVMCYNKEVQRRDPNVRSFWGKGLELAVDGMEHADGSLGGAIWGGLDDVFYTPERYAGFGPFGIIDGYRREKPEHWIVKKSYTPVKIINKEIPLPKTSQGFILKVENRFNHTNLNELTIKWRCEGYHGVCEKVDIPPHTTGEILVPVKKWLPIVNWAEGDTVNIRIERGRKLLDTYDLIIGNPIVSKTQLSNTNLDFVEFDGKINLSGMNFDMMISKKTGLITSCRIKNNIFIEGGPYLNLGEINLDPKSWKRKTINWEVGANQAIIKTSGSYGDSLDVSYIISIKGNGQMIVNYTIENTPLGHKDLTETGIYFIMSDKVNQIEWHRKGQWTIYPPNHISRLSGIAKKDRGYGDESYRKAPEWDYELDMEDYFAFEHEGADVDKYGPATRVFKSTKENIWSYSLSTDGKAGIRVEAAADIACRSTVMKNNNNKVNFYINDQWSYPELNWGHWEGWGCNQGEVNATEKHTSKVTLYLF